MTGRGFTVALIGPDGAGKTTVARRLDAELPMPVKYLYMGINPDSSNSLLPTTRLVHALKRRRGAAPDTAGPRDVREIDVRRGGGPGKRLLRGARATARLLNRLAEEWHRQLIAWRYVRRGAVVVFDRHFFADYHASDIAVDGRRPPLSRRLHGFVLSRVYPQPDLVVYLDAPAEVLLARKGEGTLESLTRRRGEYLALREVARNFRVVDAARPVDEVATEVAELVSTFPRSAA